MTDTGFTFLYGIVGAESLAMECRNGISYAKTFMPWWAGVISGFTFGLVMPWKAEWVCAGANQSAAIETVEDPVTLASSTKESR
jgi:hypothetical protein